MVVKRRINALDVVQYVTLRDKQIFPALVVEVFQTDAPARASAGQRSQSSFQTAITECPVAIIMIDAVNLPGEFGDDDVRAAVIVVILKDHSHPREPSAVFRKCCASFHPDFCEGSVSVV